MVVCEHHKQTVHALADEELDAFNAAFEEARVAGCPACAQEEARIREVRDAVRRTGARIAAPSTLHARLNRIASTARRDRPIGFVVPSGAQWRWAGGGAGFAAAACAVGLLIALPESGEQALASDLVASHVRSMQVAHLTDIPTSDKHVVKPWFDGKLDFSPPVIELKDRGFPLVGGRLDYVNHKAAAAVVYARGRHVINLFVWPDESDGGAETVREKDGYTLRHWQAGGMNFWAVSDVAPADLAVFESELKAKL